MRFASSKQVGSALRNDHSHAPILKARRSGAAWNSAVAAAFAAVAGLASIGAVGGLLGLPTPAFAKQAKVPIPMSRDTGNRIRFAQSGSFSVRKSIRTCGPWVAWRGMW